MKRILFACLILFFFVVGFSPAVAQTIRTIAFSGDPAPGLPGLTYNGFQGLHLNNRGEVFFNAGLSVPFSEMNKDTGMWKSTPHGIELIGREFEQAPGLYPLVPGMPIMGMRFNDFQFDHTYPRYLTAGDYTAFQSRILGRNPNSTETIGGPGAWFITPTGLQLISAAGEPLPGLPSGIEVFFFDQLAINSLGKVAFGARLSQNQRPTFTGGIWSDVNGSLELVAQTGHQVAGMPLGIEIFSLSYDFRPSFNDAGRIAFSTTVQGPGITGANNSVLLAGTVGNFSPIVQEGDPAPGTSSGQSFLFGTSPLLDAAGRVLFQGRLQGSGIDDTNDWGIWLEDSGSIELVAREGDQAPDLPSGVSLANFDTTRLRYSQSGHISFRGTLAGPGVDSSNDQGVWWGTPDELQLVAREGGTLPGLFAGESPFNMGGLLNESGRLVLTAQLNVSTFDVYDQAIWAQDQFGDLQMIVKTGDLLEVAPGVFLQARQLTFGGFNDRGQVLFRASFQTDLPFQTIYQSGIFVSNLVAVPEPSSLMLSACLMMFVVGRRQN